MRRWTLVLAAALLVLLAGVLGCRRAEADTGPVEYRRSGGIAGVELVLRIAPDGSAVLERNGKTTEWTLAEEQMAALQEHLEALDLSDLPEPGPVGQGRDLLEYALTYGGETVRTRDTQVPEELAPVLDLLAAIVADSPR